MNTITLRPALAVVAVSGSLVALAEDVNTTDGLKTVIESVAPLGNGLRYLSGGDGLIGYGATYPTMADTPANRAFAMENADHTWLQYAPTIYMASSKKIDRVFAVPGVDHGPNPYENLEFIIWGSGDGGWTWEEGKIDSIYRDGFDTANTEPGHSDDYTSLWVFKQSYDLFAITSGNHLVGYGQDSEGEIDALTEAVPEPTTMVALVAGAAAIARKRRK